MKTRQGLCALSIAALLVVTCVGAAAASPAGMSPQSVSPGGYTFYTVRPGDNLYRISLRFGLSMYAIMQANGLINPNYVYAGQVLRIPTGSVYPAPNPHPYPQPVDCAYGRSTSASGPCQPQPPVGGNWRGEYFNNDQLNGNPSVIRYDPAIDFDWGLGSPDSRICADHSSVRWTRSLWLGAGTYRFTMTTDDGGRLWVDDTLAIDQWKEQPATTYTADMSLGAGYHNIRMEHFELTGVALAHLNWSLVQPGGPGPCDPCATSVSTGGWFGQYYDNMTLGGDPTFTRMDGAVDFDWPNGSPGNDIPRSFWSARWTQTAYFSAAKYRFHAIVDDGVRVFVDGKVVIDEWEDNPGTEFIADKWIESGNHQIKVEFYQHAYQAKIKVWWEKQP